MKTILYDTLLNPYTTIDSVFLMGYIIKLAIDGLQEKFDFRTGIGVQKITGEQANFIRKTGSFIIRVKYNP